jgi:hypothetical protein
VRAGGLWDVFAATDSWRQSSETAAPPECVLLFALNEQLSIEAQQAKAAVEKGSVGLIASDRLVVNLADRSDLPMPRRAHDFSDMAYADNTEINRTLTGCLIEAFVNVLMSLRRGVQDDGRRVHRGHGNSAHCLDAIR